MERIESKKKEREKRNTPLGKRNLLAVLCVEGDSGQPLAASEQAQAAHLVLMLHSVSIHEHQAIAVLTSDFSELLWRRGNGQCQLRKGVSKRLSPNLKEMLVKHTAAAAADDLPRPLREVLVRQIQEEH